MPALAVYNFSKSFGKTEVLRDVSFSLEQGEVLAIIGSSGSGKTTLLRCLNFLEFADAGSICVNGEPVFRAGAAKPTEAELRKSRLHFGLVFQQFNLFPQYTVLKNVTLAPRLLRAGAAEDITDKALALLERVGLTDKRDSYPYALSGGQQQRVAIARALALDPDILCFDEPTSALDPALTGEVLRVIQDLRAQRRTMVVVTHDMDVAKSVADKVLFIADGAVEEFGTPDEVFSLPKSPKTKEFLRLGKDVSA